MVVRRFDKFVRGSGHGWQGVWEERELTEFPTGIFGVGANLLDQQHAILVAHQNNEAEIVAADIEDDAVAGEEIRRPVTVLNILRFLPFGILGFFEPRG